MDAPLDFLAHMTGVIADYRLIEAISCTCKYLEPLARNIRETEFAIPSDDGDPAKFHGYHKGLITGTAVYRYGQYIGLYNTWGICAFRLGDIRFRVRGDSTYYDIYCTESGRCIMEATSRGRCLILRNTPEYEPTRLLFFKLADTIKSTPPSNDNAQIFWKLARVAHGFFLPRKLNHELMLPPCAKAAGFAHFCPEN